MATDDDDIRSLPDPGGELRILHGFADYGVESEVLADYGSVVRVSINPRGNGIGDLIRADLTDPPFSDEVFDLGVFHPPCGKFSDMTSISGDESEWENLIPAARRVGEKCCRDYVIENKPKAPLQDPLILNGKQFGLPVVYERAFETTFTVTAPPRKDGELETEVSPYFYSDRSLRWWASVKGYPSSYPKQHLAKNTVPRAYMMFLMRNYLRTRNSRDADRSRSSHSDDKPLRLQQ